MVHIGHYVLCELVQLWPFTPRVLVQKPHYDDEKRCRQDEHEILSDQWSLDALRTIADSGDPGDGKKQLHFSC